MGLDTTGLRKSFLLSSHSISHWKHRRTAFMSMSSMPFESPAEQRKDTKSVTKSVLEGGILTAMTVMLLRIHLTLKGVYVLASSLLEWHVQLFPPHTLNTEVGKAANPDRKKEKHICLIHTGKKKNDNGCNTQAKKKKENLILRVAGEVCV